MNRKDAFICLFLLGLMMFSYPAINIFEPVLAKYFYAAWAFLIAMIGLLAYLQGR
ncbi:hypothetical protein SCOR_27885 [Sulfidibacter corallicola]